jgi:ABC-type Mn2+/Zn2+ transport system permease subunit
MQKTKTSFHAIDVAIIGLIVILTTHIFFLTPIFERSISLNWTLKLFISFLAIAPLSFFMGMPFPLGLTWIKKSFEQGIPWAWGINGCASVIGSIFSILLLMHFGYTIVTLLVVVMYLTALVIFKTVFLKNNNY